jgi:hypothetical protein
MTLGAHPFTSINFPAEAPPSVSLGIHIIVRPIIMRGQPSYGKAPAGSITAQTSSSTLYTRRHTTLNSAFILGVKGEVELMRRRSRGLPVGGRLYVGPQLI